jgi:hypothetical protein
MVWAEKKQQAERPARKDWRQAQTPWRREACVRASRVLAWTRARLRLRRSARVARRRERRADLARTRQEEAEPEQWPELALRQVMVRRAALPARLPLALPRERARGTCHERTQTMPRRQCREQRHPQSG